MDRNERSLNGGGRLRFLVLHGPNTNLFGRRETNIYGLETLEFIDEKIRGGTWRRGDHPTIES